VPCKLDCRPSGLEREEPQTMDDVLIGAGTKVSEGSMQSASMAIWPRGAAGSTIEMARLVGLRDCGPAVDHVHDRPAPDIGHVCAPGDVEAVAKSGIYAECHMT
jgi:hypothetical protein